jgi:broad specificity phosphatase PhoE
MDSMAKAPELVVLYVCRHGETALNASGCFRGNKDVPLNQNGIRDAHNLKKLFEDEPLSFVIGSDRKRAVQTADIIREGRDIAKHVSPQLRALDVGDFSGKPRDKTNVELLQTYLDRPDEDIPGGESLNDFRGRIDPAIWEAFGMADDAGLPGMVIGHSSIIHELGQLFGSGHKSSLVEPGGVVAVYVRNGRVGVQPIYRSLASSDSYGRADTVS